jgi:hypothetical protein
VNRGFLIKTHKHPTKQGKNMTNSTQKWSSRAGKLLAGVVILATTVVLVNASVTLGVPNAVTYPYSIAAGGAFNVGLPYPALDRPILLMGTCTTVGERGVGQVTMLSPLVAPTFLEWTGLESPSIAGTATVTSGYSDVLGTHIVYLDYGNHVDIEVHSGSVFRVHNESSGTRTGHITLIW